jgi:hypothetical protein
MLETVVQNEHRIGSLLEDLLSRGPSVFRYSQPYCRHAAANQSRFIAGAPDEVRDFVFRAKYLDPVPGVSAISPAQKRRGSV